MSATSTQSKNTCFIEYGHWQGMQSGRGSFFRMKLWVVLEWPIRHLVNTTWSFLFPKLKFDLPTIGWISNNLLLVCWSQWLCHRSVTYFKIRGLKSLKGIVQLSIGSFSASLASWSTAVFPWIPTWLGTQRKKLLFLKYSNS